MKIFTPPAATYIIRLAITKSGWKGAKYINLCETTMEKAELLVKHIVLLKDVSPFEKGRVTSVTIRESMGSENGRTKSISFKGLDVDQTHEALLNFLSDDVNLKKWLSSLL